jgi:hypothetical protein
VLDGLRQAVDERIIDERLARTLQEAIAEIESITGGDFAVHEFLGTTLHFCLFRATNSARTEPIEVLLTLASESNTGSVQQLELVARMQAKLRDARIGLNYSIGRTKEWRYLCSTFHVECETLGTFVANQGANPSSRGLSSVERVSGLLDSIYDQIALLHESGFTHGDISPTNILVDADWNPHLIDFDLVSDAPYPTDLNREGGNRQFDHPRRAARLAAVVDNSDPYVPIEVRVGWDLYALGQTLRAVFNEYAPEEFFRPIPAFEQRYYALMFCRLLDGENRAGESVLGLSVDRFAHLKYESARDAQQDLRKLSGAYSVIHDVPELDPSVPDRLQVSSRFEVVLTARLKRLLQVRELQALASVRQLGLISLVFPTANHTRFEHALGTYAATCQYIRWLLRDDLNPVFLQVLSPREVRAVLLAAVLHDIGHFPLAHDFEDAEGSLFDHEARTRRILEDSESELASLITRPEPDGWGVSVEDVTDILASERHPSIVVELLRSIISGPIDADKVDYLVRDSERLAVRYGEGIDLARLGATLTTVIDHPTQGPGIFVGVMEKGVGAAETVAFARYAMFRNVYWHHSYRVIKAMIQWVVWEFLRKLWIVSYGRPADFRNAVQSDLADIVGGRSARQLTLFASSGSSAFNLSEHASIVPTPERVVLEWCARGSASARVMVDSLLERRLFSRVLVMSVARDLPEDVWLNQLAPFFVRDADGGGAGWKRRYILARRFQQFLVKEVASSERGGSYLLGGDSAAAAFAREAAHRQVVLIDFPNPARAQQQPLRFLVEEERRHRRVSTHAELKRENSRIFDDIAENFTAAIGKVRVFVDPEFAPVVVDSLAREQLQTVFMQMLDEARLCTPDNEPELDVTQ